ncbi:MAG: KTSC domain-containing protein [Deltaproteobacteria bacterium]|jgi:hypothetical protein|nr:KTSC domain-containing protein [Deltaproteobacteria bacterium]
MKRTSVDSSNLAAVGYDSESNELEITFRDGRVYMYEEVPEEIAGELLRAPSKGRYFTFEIRDGGYQCFRFK